MPTTDPRAALQRFTHALQEHFAASSTRKGENDPNVVSAYRELAEAFEAYDESLMEAYGEVTPFEIFDDEDDEDDRDLEELDDDDEDEDFEIEEGPRSTS